MAKSAEVLVLLSYEGGSYTDGAVESQFASERHRRLSQAR